MNDAGTVLVIGAGGFIGGRIVERFTLGDATDVVAGVHRFANAPRVARVPTTITELDVLDEESLRTAMENCEYVVNCVLGDRAAIADGTENILRAAIDTRIERVVHLSTAEVYGDDDGVYDESSPLRYTGNEYTDAKIDAEKHCAEYMSRGLSVTVLRPTIVYGPFSDFFTVGIARKLNSGLWGKIPALDGICNPVYVDDVVHAVERSLTTSEAHNERFTVSGPNVLSWDAFFRRFNERAGITELSPRSFATMYLWAASIMPLRWLGRRLMSDHDELIRDATARSTVLERAAEFARDRIEESPTIADLDLYRRKAIYPTTKAETVLGYEPRFDLKEGLALSVEWLRHHGYLE